MTDDVEISAAGASASMRKPMVVWRFFDGKPGHENQSLGLIEALSRLGEVTSHDIDARAGAWKKILLRGADALNLPRPDLLVGAGHKTHLAVLAARHRAGGRSVVLMKPTLPVSWFDLCIAPEHDRVSPRENVMTVRGVLNRICPSANHDPTKGLFLIGGPSKHADWNDDSVVDQVVKIADACKAVKWELTTSRRTPTEFLSKLSTALPSNIAVTPCEQTEPAWVSERVAHAGQVWVSEDSVSMVYEALTSGAGVGLIEVSMKRGSRVSDGLTTLCKDGTLTRYSKWNLGKELNRPAVPLNEAERCARAIVDRWFS